MFEGFETARADIDGVGIHFRKGGSGSAVVLLHGYPQSHFIWRLMAPALAADYSVVVPDLRGYGDSDCPAGDAEHRAYSKRTMAADIAGLMRKLGHQRFAVVSHDRGARVGYRLALDHPERVRGYVSLDVIPTGDMWAKLNKDGAMGSFHWLFLAQPAPLAETMIGKDPDLWLEWLLRSWAAPGFVFDADAMAEYRRCFRNPNVIRGTCEDYRAGATCDDADDQADQAAGRKIACPALCLWGAARAKGGPKSKSPLDAWRQWCSGPVSGAGLTESGHFIPEEAPVAALAHIQPFLASLPD